MNLILSLFFPYKDETTRLSHFTPFTPLTHFTCSARSTPLTCYARFTCFTRLTCSANFTCFTRSTCSAHFTFSTRLIRSTCSRKCSPEYKVLAGPDMLMVQLKQKSKKLLISNITLFKIVYGTNIYFCFKIALIQMKSS
jgi:hypothetical protein